MGDSQIDMLDLGEVKAGAPTELAEARKLREEMGDELPADKLADIERLLEEATEFIPAVEELTYLGETARGTPKGDGDMWIMSMLIGRFSLYESLIGPDQGTELGSTPIHSVQCHKTPKDCGSATPPRPSGLRTRTRALRSRTVIPSRRGAPR